MDSKTLEMLLDACFVAKRITETLPQLPKGMKPRHIHVLQAVYELQTVGGGCRVSDVSRRLNITMPSITKLVQELADKGLLRKCGERDDKRVILLEMTEAGNACVQRYVIDFHREWAAGMGDISLAEVKRTVNTMTQLLNTMPGLEDNTYEKIK